ncbi:MAG: class I SAM-dependent methyltransferase [Pseudomonadota bacterium]|nr:class I SAM-dependent methyltransferase [Pseudomonadota bacterium]
MTEQEQPLSPHRHISFTAHYTGYIWYQLGWSHAALASRKGHRLAALMHPLELLMERYVGGSMRSTLKQRHTLIDRQLDRLLDQYPDLQVLEIAAGLSPRGWRYRQKHPHLTYVEADLPDMAAAKRVALQHIEQPTPRIEAVDLFTDQLSTLLRSFDPERPLVVISEGLVNYFTQDMLVELWGNLAEGLSQFPVGVYLTDIYPEPIKHRLARLIWNASRLLKVLSRSAFTFHFQSPEDLRTLMNDTGFYKIKVFQPSNDDAPMRTDHFGDLVWVIEAQI